MVIIPAADRRALTDLRDRQTDRHCVKDTILSSSNGIFTTSPSCRNPSQFHRLGSRKHVTCSRSHNQVLLEAGLKATASRLERLEVV